MNPPRFFVALRPHHPDDLRFQALALGRTANSIQTGDGRISALTFLFRFGSDTLAEGGIADIFLHTSAPLSPDGLQKLTELRGLLQAAVQKALLISIPETTPLLRDNVFRVIVDVRRGTQTEDQASYLVDFDFGRALRAVETLQQNFRRDFEWWGSSLWTVLSSSFQTARLEAAEQLISEEVREHPARIAAGFEKLTAAIIFRKAVEEHVGPVLGRVFAANLSAEQRATIQERGFNPGRMTVMLLGDGSAQHEPPRLATEFVQGDSPEHPILALEDSPDHVVEPRRPTLVALEEDLPGPTERAKSGLEPQDPPRGLHVVPVNRNKSRSS